MRAQPEGWEMFMDYPKGLRLRMHYALPKVKKLMAQGITAKQTLVRHMGHNIGEKTISCCLDYLKKNPDYAPTDR